MLERCQDHDKLSEEVKGTKEIVLEMRSDLKNAIKEVTDHIQAGSRWRMTIFIVGMGLIGTVVAGVVRFSVMEYKIISIQDDQKVMRTQIYDLNFEKGRAVGLGEAKK